MRSRISDFGWFQDPLPKIVFVSSSYGFSALVEASLVAHGFSWNSTTADGLCWNHHLGRESQGIIGYVRIHVRTQGPTWNNIWIWKRSQAPCRSLQTFVRMTLCWSGLSRASQDISWFILILFFYDSSHADLLDFRHVIVARCTWPLVQTKSQSAEFCPRLVVLQLGLGPWWVLDITWLTCEPQNKKTSSYFPEMVDGGRWWTLFFTELPSRLQTSQSSANFTVLRGTEISAPGRSCSFEWVVMWSFLSILASYH